MLSRAANLAALICFAALMQGCGGSAPPPQTGFLSDYGKLTAQDGAMRFKSPDLKNYNAFILDPVVMGARRDKSPLTPQEAADVAQYFNESLTKSLTKHGFKVVNKPGVSVARVRVAVTDIKESTWWMNIHPGSKLTGAGTGGASMEGEVIDSINGNQLAAVVQGGKGNQFELDTFSKLDDIKDTIDGWTETAAKRLEELRAAT